MDIVKIGNYSIPKEKAQMLFDLGKQIDSKKEELSKEEENMVEEIVDHCKGDVSCAEALLRKTISMAAERQTIYVHNSDGTVKEVKASGFKILGGVKIPEMIDVPAGTFKMGSGRSIKQVKISAFKLGKYEVTNDEYVAYLKATGQEISGNVADEKLYRHPVVNVNWNDAVEYCEWLSKETGRKFRLLIEAEWEYAARGTNGRKYPWGNEWDPSRAAFQLDETVPVGSYPNDASPFGIMDMAGNVGELTGDLVNPNDLIDPRYSKIYRGGSFDDYRPEDLQSARRYFVPPESRLGAVGFRVAEDLK